MNEDIKISSTKEKGSLSFFDSTYVATNHSRNVTQYDNAKPIAAK